MFAVHRVNEKLYFEIPRNELSKDMLLVGRYSRAAAANPRLPGGQFGNYGGDQFAERTLRWDRSGNRIVLRSPSFAIVADTSTPIYRAVEAGDHARARRLQAALTPLAVAVTATYGIAGLKAAVDAAGLRGGHVRAPLLPLAPAARDEIRALVAAANESWRA